MIRKLLAVALLTAGLAQASLVQAETIRWSRSSDAATLDPHSVNTGTNINISHQIYEPLVLRDIKGKLIPALATSWKLKPRYERVWISSRATRRICSRVVGASRDVDAVAIYLL